MIPFLDRESSRGLGARVSFRRTCVRIGKGLRPLLGRGVLVAYDKGARRMLFVTASREEAHAAYPIDRRGRVFCQKALRVFGLDHVRGIVKIESKERGRVSIVFPARMLKKKGAE